MSNIKYYRVKLLAQLPVTSASDGDLYFVRENQKMYVWDSEALAMVSISGGSVASVFGRTGAVIAEVGDYSAFFDSLGAAASALATAEAYTDSETSRAEAAEALLAPKNSPTFTGTVAGITAAMVGADVSGAAATAQSNAESFATSAVGAETSRAETAEALALPKAGGTMTGALTISDTAANADLIEKNTTVATSGTTNASPLHELAANYWTGAASAADTWTIGSSLAAGTNGVSTLTIAHSGSTGTPAVLFPQCGSIKIYSDGNGGRITNCGTISGNTSEYIYLNSSLGIAFGTSPQWSNAILLASVYGFCAAQTSSTGTIDTGISRLGAASLAIGNGTAGDKTGTLSLSRVNAFSGDLAGSVSSAPSGIVAATVVVAVGAATATFTVTSTEGFTVGDTVTLSAGGWTGGSGLASTTATVASITNTTTMVLTYVSGGPWVAGTYSTQTGTLAQTGGTSVTVTYKTAYTNTPFVTVTPTSNCGAWYVSAQSTGGFTITYTTSGTQTFNYHVIGNQS